MIISFGDAIGIVPTPLIPIIESGIPALTGPVNDSLTSYLSIIFIFFEEIGDLISFPCLNNPLLLKQYLSEFKSGSLSRCSLSVLKSCLFELNGLSSSVKEFLMLKSLVLILCSDPNILFKN